MKKRPYILLYFFLAVVGVYSQNPSCPSPYVYMDGGPFIKYYDPNQPMSATNPNTLNIPTFGGGLTLMPNINGGTLSPTFYSTSGGNYWYWSGSAWVNTGHSTGNGAAVNLGGCNGSIYNIVGGSGQIYVYNGTGNGTLLTTLTGFNGGGPYDLVTDCNCNFYALNTTTPNQSLIMYNSAGVPQCTYTLSGMPNSSAGGGFAIIGNQIYVRNGSFYVGTIGSTGITFTSVPGFTNNPGDFASCPVCYASNTLTGASVSGGALSCSNSTVSLVATTTVSPVNYNWSGPGIVGSTTGSAAVANIPGTYSVTITAGGCPGAQVTLTTSVLNNSATVTAAISPSGNICLPIGGSIQLVVAHTSSTDVILWTGSSIPAIPGPATLNINTAGTYTVQVFDIPSGCMATDMVVVASTPSVSMSLTSFTFCALPTSGSPASMTITPAGATNYTLLTSGNVSTSAQYGPVMPIVSNTASGTFISPATATLIGKNNFCVDTAYTAFQVIPNPTIVPSASLFNICPGLTQPLTVSGATTYTWTGSSGLNIYSGSNVVAAPAANAVYSVMGTDAGCRSTIASVSVNILPLPIMALLPPSSTICLGSAATITAVGTATAYLWSPGTGLSSVTGQSVSAAPPYTQLYTVTGYLNTCTVSASAVVHIVQPPVLSLALNSPSLCAANYNGSPSTLSVTASGANSYSLAAPPNIMVSFPTGPTMVLSYNGPQPLTTTVLTTTVTGVTGVCTVKKTQTISVVPNPVLTITPPNSSICPGKKQTFVASGATSYTWLPAPNYTLLAPNVITASPPYTNFYPVFGQMDGCRSDTKNAVLVILPIPTVSITPATSTVCAGNTVALVAGGNAATYSWSPAGSLVQANGATVIANPAATQEYTLAGTLNTCTNMAVATVSVIVIPVISASATDYTVCSGASTILKGLGAQYYQWSPSIELNQGSGDVVIASPTGNTTFTVRGYNGICTGSTTLNIITVKPPNMSIVAAQNAICKGSSIPIQVRGAHSYTWVPIKGLYFNGTDSMVTAAPLETTNYTVIGANSMGTVSCYQQLSYSVMVISKILATASSSVNLCLGEKATIYGYGGNTFNWAPSNGLNNTNGSGVVASPSVTTIYTVHVSHDSYCGASATVQVNVNPRPKVVAGPDAKYNLNEVIVVRAEGTGTLTWIQGEGIVCTVCPETQVYPTHRSCYIVQTINDEGCTAFDDICIDVTEDFSVYIPNTFSPNNDGTNDIFYVYGEGIYDVKMEIYDRWGTRVFSSSDVRLGWDGNYNDGICKVDVYTYVVSYKGLDRKLYTRSGHVNLLK